jgi:hypothetical protein
VHDNTRSNPPVATDAQMAANKRNAAHSRGPKTDAGKDASRRNALKHGMTGSGEVLAGELRETVAERAAEFTERFRPSTVDEFELVEQLAIDTVRLERCRELFVSSCENYGKRARHCWEGDRRLEAEEVAARLARDPARVSRRLRQNRQGCELLIDRWEALGRILEQTGAWTDGQRELALDLLGVPPELRDGDTAVDPPGASEDAEEEARPFRLGVVAKELATLRRLKADALDGLDEDERAIAETTLGAEFSPALMKLNRYEAACLRRQSAAIRQLSARDHERSETRDESSDVDEQPATMPPPPRPAPVPPRPAAATVLAAAPRAVTAPNAIAPVTLADAVDADSPRPNRRDRRYLASVERRNT